VFSNSAAKWCAGVVTKVTLADQPDKQNHVQVEYKQPDGTTMSKSLQFESEDLRRPKADPQVAEKQAREECVEAVSSHLAGLELSDHAEEVVKAFDELEYAPASWVEHLAKLKAELPEGWSEHIDDEGTPYYYDESTEESSWDPPAGVTADTLRDFLAGCTKGTTKLEPVPPPAEVLLCTGSRGAGDEEAKGFVSKGSMAQTIADSEDALSVFYSRLIVVANLRDIEKPASFVGALRPLFLPDGPQLTVRNVQLTEKVPFLLEAKMKELGAEYVSADPWSENAVLDGRLATGQNPQSSVKCARLCLQALA